MKKTVLLKVLIVVLVIVLFIFTLSTCGKKEEPVVQEPVDQEPVVEDKEPVVKEPEPVVDEGPEFVNPLTGEETAEDVSMNRPYAVMVNNIEYAQPQHGVSKADIIYEILVEGGITRHMAVFQDISEAEVVGSIRSSRHYYVGIAMGHEAHYIHAGGSPYAYDLMSSIGADNIDGVNGSGETFYRDDWRRSNLGYEHSLMLDTTLLPQYFIDHEQDTEHSEDYECSLKFTDTPVTAAGEAANNVDVYFSNYKGTYFEYSEEDKVYYVSQYGGAYKDGNTDEQVNVKNLIVIYGDTFGISGDSKGRLDADFTGEGTGYYCCEGKYIPITWEREDDMSEFKYLKADGTDLELAVGNSYICIVDLDRTVDIY